MTIQSSGGGLRSLGRASDQQAAGCLWIEEQVTVLLGNALGETHTSANKVAVIFQAAGEKSFTRGFDSARKIGNRRMIDLQGDGLDTPLRIPKRHLSSVAQQAESRNVRHCVNRRCSCLFF